MGEDIPSLRQLYFYLTEGCNLSCRHCWLEPPFDDTGVKYPHLPVELFEKALMEAGPLGLTGVKLTGGEPLLHPGIGKLLKIIRRRRLALNIETNGLLCDPAMAREIAKSPVRFAAVSIDGADASTHEGIRGAPGSFDAAVKAVRALAAAGVPPQVIITVMECNAGQIVDFVRMAEKLGASSVKFNIPQPMGRGESIHGGPEWLGLRDIILLGHRVDNELAPTTRMPLYFDYPMAFRPLRKIAGDDGGRTCNIREILGVISTGHYALCGIGKKLPGMVFGSVCEDGLEGLWKTNETLLSVREGIPGRLEGVCSRCIMRGRCLGSCIAQNYYLSGSLWDAFWFCDEAEKSGLFPESRLEIAKIDKKQV